MFTWIGDDLLLLQFVLGESSNYTKSLIDTLLWSGQDKWRPVWQIVQYIIFNLFQDDLIVWTFLRAVLYVFCLIQIWKICSNVGLTKLRAAFAISIITISPFTWYLYFTVFGTMELLGLYFALNTVRIMLEKSKGSIYFLRINTYFIFSVLSHERYIFLIFPIICWIFIKNKNNVGQFRINLIQVSTVIFLALAYVIIRINLGTKILTTGGESSFNINTVLSAPIRFMWAFFGLLGSTPANYNERFSFIYISNKSIQVSSLGIIVVLVTIALTLLVLKYVNFYNGEISSQEKSINLNQNIILGSVGISLLIPSTFVVERIENRWLLLSFISLYILVLTNLKHIKTERNNMYQDFTWLFVFVFITINMILSSRYAFSSDNPYYFQNRELKKFKSQIELTKSDILYLNINTNIPYTEWLLGRGYFFTHQNNSLKNSYIILVKIDQKTGEIRTLNKYYKNVDQEIGYRYKPVDNFGSFIMGLVDSEYYYSRYPDVLNANLSAGEHFLNHGIFENRVPNSNPEWKTEIEDYLSQHLMCYEWNFYQGKMKSSPIIKFECDVKKIVSIYTS